MSFDRQLARETLDDVASANKDVTSLDFCVGLYKILLQSLIISLNSMQVLGNHRENS